MLKKLPFILVCLLILTTGTIFGCSKNEPATEGFAIYLTRDNIPPDRMEMLSHVEIADEPLISEADIVSYMRETHEIRLTPDAFERIMSLEVPVSGTSFVICVNAGPVYWGAFWTPLSSISFDGITIWKPFSSDNPVIRITAGYPSEDFHAGDDPRNNPEVLNALDQAGKLIDFNPDTSTAPLPHSMKGYELYSWQQAGEWHFRLITGTNRNKTMEEIVSGTDTYSDFASLLVTGVKAVESLLARLPVGEEVFWLSQVTDGTVTDGQVSIELPDENAINEITHYAENSGINMAVPSAR